MDIDNEGRSFLLTDFNHMINNRDDKRNYIPLPMFLLCGWSNMKQCLIIEVEWYISQNLIPGVL